MELKLGIFTIQSLFESFDWGFYTKLFLLGAFPWISQLRKLDIHFKTPNHPKLKTAFNLFASIFSMALFLMMRGVLDKTIISTFLDWKWFIGIALISLFAFFSLYIYFKEKVSLGFVPWVIILSLFFYISIFINLTASFGILRVYSNNYLLKGLIVDSNNQDPINRATIKLFTIDNSFVRTDLSNDHGEYLVLFEKKKLDSILQINDEIKVKVEHSRYLDFRYTIVDLHNAEQDINYIELTKEENDD